ncbi:axial regulator YABBY 4 [Olea europaea subsp. europaea]|uniref:Axial regulator YABBY 4 n=1 Tax=Olea europaea subsp. europaea TaxID=158383 RepID=A0A8S0SUS0_OLEEU|nr:axial regulator YABBY 4 [Olea europaea subsp. europaea]
MSTFNYFYDHQEQICYVKCGYCTTILLVSVPCNSLSMEMTVKCEHCTTLLLVQPPKQEVSSQELDKDERAIKMQNPSLGFSSEEEEENISSPINQVINKPPEKRQRAPSAYNYFIKEEIRRLKAEYPGMTHKQAFSTAAKNWAHFPQRQYNGGDGYGEGERKMAKYSDAKEVASEGNSFLGAKTPFY